MKTTSEISVEWLVFIGTSVMVLLVLGIIYFIFLYQTRLYKQREEMRIKEALQQKALFRAGYESQENERKRIAQDLHDEIGANLSTLSIYNNLLSLKINQEGKDELSKSKKLIDDTVQNLRAISKSLTPAVLENFGLARALAHILENVSDAREIKHTLAIEEDLTQLPSDLALMLYRVTQELANNTSKYAQATEINLKLYFDENGLYYTYSDNGIGFDLNTASHTMLNGKTSTGLGLKNIESRVTSFEGKFQLTTQLNAGVEFNFYFPKRVLLNGQQNK